MQHLGVLACLAWTLGGCAAADGADPAEEELATVEESATSTCASKYRASVNACGLTYNNGYRYGCWVDWDKCVNTTYAICKPGYAQDWCIEESLKHCEEDLDDCYDAALDKYNACKQFAMVVYLDCKRRQ